jgi:hypothetical protein
MAPAFIITYIDSEMLHFLARIYRVEDEER